MSHGPIIVEAAGRTALGDGRLRLSCVVRIDKTTAHDVWIHIPADAAPATDDWMLPLMVVPAMEAGRALRIVGRVSAKLLGSVPAVQRVFKGFDDAIQPAPVTADEVVVSPSPPSPRTAAFFSAGLDSWYTALAHGDALDDLVFGIGIDMRPDDHERIALVLPRVREAAAAIGKPLIVFETNLRVLYYGSGKWSTYYMGAGLASCALAMSGRYTRFLIPATYSARDQHLHWGTSARLDPLWSSESLEIVHDGAVSRVEKARLLATNEGAMRTLRVCWSKEAMAYNCGRCGKCLRTMVALRLAGALERCRTFDRPLDLAAVAAMPYDPVGSIGLRLDLLAEATKDEKHADVLSALCENVLRRPLRGPSPQPASAATTAMAARTALSVGGKLRREIARVLRRIAGWVDSSGSPP